jgi:hypothetical protein
VLAAARPDLQGIFSIGVYIDCRTFAHEGST